MELPHEFLLMTGAIALGMLAIRVSGRGRDSEVWRVVQRMLLVAVVVARLAYVFQYRTGYLQDWHSFFNFRDGGWDAEAGIVAAWLYAVLALKASHATRIPLIAALSIVSVVWGVGSVALAMMDPDRPLSTVSVATADGTSAALSDFRGKPVVVNLLATWCPPCQRELPLLQRAQREHPEVEFVFLNEGEAGPLVAAFLAPGSTDDIARAAKLGGRLGKGAFTSPVIDFYLTNPIARASAVMAECSALAKNGFQQAAE